MQYSRRLFISALGATPFAGWSQPVVCTPPSLGALSQRMGKAWLCMADPELTMPARDVLAASCAAFEQQLAQMSRNPAGPEQAGCLRAMARRYEDYQAVLASTPGIEGHRALLSTANEMMTLAQLAKSPRRHARQVPSLPPNQPTPTRSPCFHAFTSGATSSITPAISCPGTRGYEIPGSRPSLVRTSL